MKKFFAIIISASFFFSVNAQNNYDKEIAAGYKGGEIQEI